MNASLVVGGALALVALGIVLFPLFFGGDGSDDDARPNRGGAEAVCPSCGAPVRGDARFCSSCGARLPGGAS